MKTAHPRISKAIEELEMNLFRTARVDEWAERMGYNCPKKFARSFLRHYSVRPKKVLDYIRLKSICEHLRTKNRSNFEIARRHGISDEIALNKFINYHLGCSPNELRNMTNENLVIIFDKKLEDKGGAEKGEKLGSNFW